MNILIIEDDPDFVEDITRRVSAICRDPVYTITSSKDTAIFEIQNNFFDLILLDLRIPSLQNAMDSDPENGRAVLYFSLANAPGTPLFILTGSSAEDFLPEIWELNSKVDIWGQGEPLQIIGFQQKHRITQLDGKIASYIHGCVNACDIELHTSQNLPIPVSRLIKIFTKTVGGCFCAVENIPGGLSGAHVFSLVVTDGQGAKIHDAIAKLGSRSTIQNEVDRYDRFIVRLDPRATPRKLHVLNYGARDISGVFYSLANAYTRNAFSFILDQPAPLIESTIELMNNWRSAAYQRRLTIKDIRRHFISDEKFSDIRKLIQHAWIENFEENLIQVNWGCTHSDLHGYNVLVSETRAPILIDYGDVAESACSVDPITLELSSIFHVNGPFKDGDWPSEETALLWGQEGYVDDLCPAPEFFHSCREWAIKAAVGRRERSAVAYGYLVRQLKYTDCNQSLVNALLLGVKQLYDAT
ncbi:hypothetical protein ACFFQ5_27725 [Pseudomonas brassicacearum]|uniref:response regulator n=1 Tax=Pseudomonas brassicacearum TaxID=930166 RepID=UPI00087AF9F2|nr:response regulator [Pseudomonas brassicacearum]KAB0526894.1 response regulator [Pseudomonas brassicacearum subsp. brassicacearum]NJP60563.1 response regulator [Pseudomonas brassicacearum]SDP88857.1 hypothetical protein SAMN04490180_3636 [Pseudomonas brassicacearum]